jgi:hypothetical protein
MKRLPLWMTIKIYSRAHHVNLWLPLFILGPVALIVLLALFLFSLPFLLFSLIFTPEGWDWAWWGLTAFFTTSYSLSGLKIEVESRWRHVEIAID